ncbi:hypothetical protein U1Q18_031835 [Sarracenia purpurea var. burkii]
MIRRLRHAREGEPHSAILKIRVFHLEHRSRGADSVPPTQLDKLHLATCPISFKKHPSHRCMAKPRTSRVLTCVFIL